MLIRPLQPSRGYICYGTPEQRSIICNLLYLSPPRCSAFAVPRCTRKDFYTRYCKQTQSILDREYASTLGRVDLRRRRHGRVAEPQARQIRWRGTAFGRFRRCRDLHGIDMGSGLLACFRSTASGVQWSSQYPPQDAHPKSAAPVRIE